MTFIILNADKTIHSFHQSDAGLTLAEGQTMEVSDLSFQEYAERLVLSVSGITGETVTVASEPGRIVQVNVSCPANSSVMLDVNGLQVEVPLVDAAGILELEADAPGLYVIRPADATLYCPAGNSILAVEVTE